MKVYTSYIADDGMEFASEKLCLEYERLEKLPPVPMWDINLMPTAHTSCAKFVYITTDQQMEKWRWYEIYESAPKIEGKGLWVFDESCDEDGYIDGEFELLENLEEYFSAKLEQLKKAHETFMERILRRAEIQ